MVGKKGKRIIPCDFTILRNSNLSVYIWCFIGTHPWLLAYRFLLLLSCYLAELSRYKDHIWSSIEEVWDPFSRFPHVRGLLLLANLIPLVLLSPPTCHVSGPVLLSKFPHSPKSQNPCFIYLMLCTWRKTHTHTHTFFLWVSISSSENWEWYYYYPYSIIMKITWYRWKLFNSK